MRWGLPTLAWVVMGSLLLYACAKSPASDREALRERASELDLVVVLLDAAAAGHFSFLGYDRDTTPFLAALAEESVLFEQAYAQASATPLSVLSIFTSEYPVVDELPTFKGEVVGGIPEGAPTIATLLAGRFDARIGVSANRWIGSELRFDAGFTEFVGTWHDDGQDHTATRVTDLALERLLPAPAGRSFAYLHYLEPHLPYDPPEPFASRFDPEARVELDMSAKGLLPFRRRAPTQDIQRTVRALYDGNLAYADAELRRLVEGLKEAGRWDRTAFVLLSDHGEAFWQHGVRGHGLHVYEEFVRVPFFIRIPGVEPHRVTEIVELVDLLPTLVDVFAPSNAGADWAGATLVDAMLGGSSGREGTAFARNHESHAVEYMLRRSRLKFMTRAYSRRPVLYDLREDPLEQRSLIGKSDPQVAALYAASAESLKAQLESVLLSGRLDLRSVAPESLDAAAEERLRAMGYLH